ncbi:MAG: bifunctional folylpolyglutamate synthase/dihydrofolate synthase [Gammaproteobacteria bacterium]|nr:bifunctional folylpolyglutamate synthase/dihydrofolate synthase [Gammaproteobacteria bacterium]
MAERSPLAEWLERIGTEHPRDVLAGLERVARVARCAGVTPPAPRNVIVAGTNGKGSTCVFLEQLLLAAGDSVGTTLSPHLARFNERVRVDGGEATDEALVAAFEAVERARGDTPLSYFEFAILAALRLFRTRRVHTAVLEVGLGGRLDATNVVDADVAVIVSVGLDHQEYLGDTREAIAAEKAGVLRAGRPVVYGEPDVPRAVQARAQALGAPLFAYGHDYDETVDAHGWTVRLADGRSVRTDTPPRIPACNAATAVQAWALLDPGFDPTAVESACLRAAVPGRLEHVRAEGRRWLLDTAHNPHAARFLARHLPSRVACGVLGMLEDKDAPGVVGPLLPRVARWIVTDNRLPRGLPATALRRRLEGVVTPRAIPDPDAALEAARSTTGANDVILVCGSFDLVTRARARLNC